MVQKGNLKRTIGTWGLSLNMMNIMIGAGIFVLPALVAEGLGPGAWIAYLLCGILIGLVMLCFAEVGSIITDDGGVYTYMEQSLGPYFGFKAATLYLVAAMAADAAVANALVDIADSLLPLEFSRIIRSLCFFFIFASLALINILGAKQGVTVVKFITVAKLLPLVLFILLTTKDINIQYLKMDGIPGMKDIGSVTLLLFFAFVGSEGGLSVSGEVKNPKKTVPRAILLAIGGALLLYLFIQGALLGTMGPALADVKENPLGEAARLVIGPAGFTLMIIGAGVSMFGNLSSEILSLPRLLYGAAKDRVIPVKILSRIHPRFRTPHAAIITVALIDFLLASFGGFKQLALISSAVILLVYFGMAVAVIRLRRSRKERPEGTFRIPGKLAVPLLSMAAIIWFLSNLERKEIIAVSILIGILTLIYFLVVRKLKDPEK